LFKVALPFVAMVLGAYDPTKYTFYSAGALKRGYELFAPGVEWRKGGGGRKYAEMCDFVEAVAASLRGQGVPVRDLIDAQSFIWISASDGGSIARNAPSFWLVSRGSAYQQERAGEFVWVTGDASVPLIDREAIRKMAKGDYCFHLHEGVIAAVSQVTEVARHLSSPAGYIVRVDYFDLKPPVPADSALDLREVLGGSAANDLAHEFLRHLSDSSAADLIRRLELDLPAPGSDA